MRVRGPRNHFPLVELAALPVHRRRDRHHADPDDDRGGRGARRRLAAALRRPGAVLDGLRRRAGTPRDRVTVCAAGRAGHARTSTRCCRTRARTRWSTAAGPRGCSSAVEEACKAWPEGSLHIERFSAKALEERRLMRSTSFEVECQRSGVTVTVPPTRSIYEAVEEAGVDVLGSCMEGVCGTCECDVIEGEADHRDSVLNEAEHAARGHDHDLRFARRARKGWCSTYETQLPVQLLVCRCHQRRGRPGPARAPAARHSRRALPPRLG